MDWHFQITWEKAPRWPRPPLWAAGVVALWGLLLAVARGLELRYGVLAQTCPFRWVTGRPCATCGSTRALMALARGQPAEALRLNPLISTLALAVAILLVARLVTGRKPSLRVGTHSRQAAWVIAGCLLLGNWAWVLRVLG